MKTRGVIGKRIVAIRQTRFFNHNFAGMDVDVYEIELDDGTLLRPLVNETEDEYVVDMIVVKPRRKETKCSNK